MAGILTNRTGGTPPRILAHPAAPEPFQAVAGAPSRNGENYLTNREVGVPDPRPIVVMIGNRNLVDIITELQTLLP